MNFKDYASEIAKKANVDEDNTRRVIRALFNDMTSKLDKEQNVPLPTFGRLVNRKLPNGGKRVFLTRPGQNTRLGTVNPSKTKLVKPKPRPTAQKRRPAKTKT